MASKKKDIENLINGIVGEPHQELRTEDENGNVAPEVVEQLGITPEMEEQLNAVRRAKVGRPKGRPRKEDKSKYEGRATFVVDTRLIRKVKYISLMDSKLLKDVISEALSAYIRKWENANGYINLPEKEK